MPKYEVTGEYGPQAGMNITLEIEADNEVDARDVFCERMESDHPIEWARMGFNNVRYIELIDKPKDATEIVQTIWRVKFSSRSDMIVSAATLFHVAEHVADYCKDTGTSPKDVVRIEYLAY